MRSRRHHPHRALILALPALLLGAFSSWTWADERTERKPGDLARVFPFGLRTRDAALSTKAAPLLTDGLVWLASRQRGDGSWGGPEPWMDPGVTALATLAFLGAGHVPFEGDPHRTTLERALAWLTSKMDAEGYVGRSDAQRWIYGHGFSAAALVEAAAMTGDSALLGVAQRALRASEMARNPYFAWRYGVRSGDNDTSVTGCMWWAFRAASDANRAAADFGLGAPFDLSFAAEVEDGVASWLEKMLDRDYGRVGYFLPGDGPYRYPGSDEAFPKHASEATTAVAAWFGASTGRLSTPLEKSQTLVLRMFPQWNVTGGYIDLAYWLYGSMALSAVKPGKSKPWYDALELALLTGSIRDEAGISWPAVDAWGSVGGPITTTACALLALEGRTRYAAPPGPAALSALLARAKSDPAVRALALGALALRGAPQTPDLAAKALGHEAAVVRRAALAVFLAEPPRTPQLRALGALAVSADPELAAPAARLLGHGGPGEVTPLRGALRHASPEVRAAALDALGPHLADPTLIEEARGLLATPEPMVRLAAARAIARTRGDVAAALAETAKALGDPDPRLRMRAIRTIADLGPAAASLEPALAPLTTHADVDVRLEASLAVEALLGHAAPPASPFWPEAGSAPIRVRLQDLERASRGPEAVRLAPALAATLRHPDPILRSAAIAALARLGREARAAMAELEEAAAADDEAIAKAAHAALASAMGKQPAPRDPPSLPAGDSELRAALADPVAYAGLRGAVAASGEDPASRFAALLGDQDAGVRLRAAERLGDLGPAARARAKDLLPVAKDPDPGVREAALRALARCEAPDVAIAAFAAALDDAEARVRAAALAGLAALPTPPPDLGALVKAAAAPPDGPALRALAAFGRWGSPLTPGDWAAVVVASTAPDRPLRRAKAALEAAGRLAAADWTSLDALLDVSWGGRLGLRQAAIAALEALASRDPRAAALGMERRRVAQGKDKWRAEHVVYHAGPQSLPLVLPLLEAASPDDAHDLLALLRSDVLRQEFTEVARRIHPDNTRALDLLGYYFDEPDHYKVLQKAFRAPEVRARLVAARVAQRVLRRLVRDGPRADGASLAQAASQAAAGESDPDVRSALTAARDAWKPK